MSLLDQSQRISAVLGPTNTGKTHLAIERMLGYRTGMIGFPLRLLARENYDKVVKVRGMDITFVTTAENDEHGKALLDAFGFPFRRQQVGV